MNLYSDVRPGCWGELLVAKSRSGLFPLCCQRGASEGASYRNQHVITRPSFPSWTQAYFHAGGRSISIIGTAFQAIICLAKP